MRGRKIWPRTAIAHSSIQNWPKKSGSNLIRLRIPNRDFKGYIWHKNLVFLPLCQARHCFTANCRNSPLHTSNCKFCVTAVPLKMFVDLQQFAVKMRQRTLSTRTLVIRTRAVRKLRISICHEENRNWILSYSKIRRIWEPDFSLWMLYSTGCSFETADF
jgi:hypothetical protein